ncbi:HIT-like protein [Teratosphaeria nubilosa]|uniref:Bis(5'-adenosyl)-triphosphatase n=1 Tax=Teratosphaeria nubilosa TaxID=161662 RepID=A0A6G1LQF3_9PEZI|nr:HIT-like protein [Teratosphaeria nubilosa]
MTPQDQQKTEPMPPFPGRVIHFGPFNVTSQVFHLTPRSFALINLKPLLPGHILVSPLAVKPHLSDLTAEETTDLFLTVRRLQRTLKRVHSADAFNVAVQDGEAAGQSVPHVHVHVIPRRKGDPAGDDRIHRWLEGEEGNVGGHQWDAERRGRVQASWLRDEERGARTKEEMEAEAGMLRREIERDGEEEGGGGREVLGGPCELWLELEDWQL